MFFVNNVICEIVKQLSNNGKDFSIKKLIYFNCRFSRRDMGICYSEFKFVVNYFLLNSRLVESNYLRLFILNY